MSDGHLLLSPAKIGPVVFKNRIIVSSMCLYFSGKNGEVTDKMVTFFRNRAKGGTGAFIIPANPHGENKRARGSISSDDRVEQWKPLLDAIHAEGAKAVCQIHPSGIQFGRADFTESDSPFDLSAEGMMALIESYALGARRAQRAGFDAAEIHGAHGHEVALLLSRLLNTRTDRYGGSVENCARTVTEMIARMKEFCGGNFPVILRMSGEERIPGGREIDESVEICKLAVAAGADAIHVSSGMPESEEWECPPSEIEQGHIGWMGKRLKDALSVPVIVVGRVVDWEVGERMIERGEADFVAMARTSLAEPRWALGVGRNDIPLKKCIACNQGCRTRREQNKSMAACLQNPRTGREELINIERDRNPRNICIVGAGPSGLEAADVFSERGHRVTVFERENTPGGMFRWASKTPGKNSYMNVVEYYEKLLPGRGVKTVFGANLSEVPEGRWDLVVLAVGGRAIVPPFKVENARTQLAIDFLADGGLKSDSYVVVGDGLVGYEIADYIIQRGGRVVLVGNDPREPIATQGVARWHFMKKRFDEAKLETIRHSTVEQLDGGGLTVRLSDGSVRRIDGDFDYIIACGYRQAPAEFIEKFTSAGIPVLVVGNAGKPGDAMDAIHDAFDKALAYSFE
ncbi:MAG: NAD(P)/FAD-dependent oxidoreductase [Synergistaceae bacterium]|jgi:2,4-dienoyl-CoA reductase-like NADH-dependent reductase (Old Yellow Enzyme family)|nr:NAD(P)/FAD-dependent oxidoreductase [Synergistaceae bacterium]